MTASEVHLPAESKVLRAGPWIALGTGGAALISAGVFELLRRSREDAAKLAPQTQYRESYDSMSRHQTTARVLVGVGGGLVLVGGAWALLEGRRTDVTEQKQAMLGCDALSCYGTVTLGF